MSMTMSGTRQTDGKISVKKLCRRYANLLNLVYLQGEPVEGGGYRIPEKTFELIQTELDFNPPTSRSKKKIEEELKTRYRQRDSYRFWKDILDASQFPTEVEARECLYRIYTKLDSSQHYGTMTHSRYALETLQLAIDDKYGTNKTLIQNPALNFSKKPKSKKNKMASISNNGIGNDIVPF